MPPSLVITPPAAAGGGSPISNPEVAYVRTDGNDGTAELGNPAKPYLTATAAFAALKASHASTSHQHSFNLGVGDFELTMTPAEVAAGYQLFLVGEGGSVDAVDQAGSTLTISSVGAFEESIGVSLILRSNLSVKIFADIVAGDGGDADITGNIYCWAANLELAGSSAGGAGANTLTAHGKFCVLTGSANYGAVTGCYVDGVFEYV